MMYFLAKPEKTPTEDVLKTTTTTKNIYMRYCVIFFSEIDKSYILGFGIVCNIINL